MKKFSVFILSLFGFLSIQTSSAQHFCQYLKHQESQEIYDTQDARADSFDILHYHIKAAFPDFQNEKSIDAVCEIDMLLKTDATQVRLDLTGLDVSSVELGGSPVAFTLADPSLFISLGDAQSGDSLQIRISYSGKPKQDAQWGGFYFVNQYAFNLGVAFADQPHNYGRVWFPCIDNFTDRALYSFDIQVDSMYSAYCNGKLQDRLDQEDGTVIYKWVLRDPIPTYLASVAIAPYEELNYSINTIPVILAAIAPDTADLRSSFVHLPECVNAFIVAYGSHSFERIGFNMVPFNGGAMEHATNIAYPLFAIKDGTLDYETLMAHEFAHHWWGNTTTCAEAEDMWLNEGWASYSESLFLEYVYGNAAYKKNVAENHKNVLHYAHIRDDEALPVSGISHEHTYGMHVYDKGADMVHTLRGFMGDEDFFTACSTFQQTFKFSEVSTQDLQDHFQQYSSVALAAFFKQWINTAGFVRFYIFSVEKENEQSYQLRIKQDQRFNTLEYSDVPYKISAFSADFARYDTIVLLGGRDQYYSLYCPFEPVYWVLDFDEKISDAVSDEWLIVKDTGAVVLETAMIEVGVREVKDSILLRVEHHWLSPDQYFMNIPNLFMSRQRYWNIDGIWKEDFKASAVLEYNGQMPFSNPASGFLDHELIKITEDSLVLLYRPNPYSEWQICDNYSRAGGSVFDKKGSMVVEELRKGQYALAIYHRQLLSGTEKMFSGTKAKIIPNPAKDIIRIEFEQQQDCCLIEITDIQGRVLKSEKIKSRSKNFEINISDLSTGTYFVGLVDGYRAYERVRFVKNN